MPTTYRRGLSYADAESKLGKRDSKKLANNTYLHRVLFHESGRETLAVRLHNTDVVLIHKDGSYTLNSGGWRTVTTKDRINTYSPASVYQSNNIWYVGNGDIFTDGMKVDGDGKPLGSLFAADAADVEKKKKRLDKLTREYIDGFAAYVREHGLYTGEDAEKEKGPWDVVELAQEQNKNKLRPSEGDCWGCYFGLSDENKDHSPRREPMGVDHLLQHFEERYYVPSLLYKAIQDRGYASPGFIWHTIADEAKRGEDRMLKDVLRAYFRKRKPVLLEHME